MTDTTPMPEDITMAAHDAALAFVMLTDREESLSTLHVAEQEKLFHIIASALKAEREKSSTIAANEAERRIDNEEGYDGVRAFDAAVTARRIQAAISGTPNAHLSDAVRERITDDKTHPRFIAGYDAGLADGKRERHGTDARLPQDVINLVIAAREAFDTGDLPMIEERALDEALEAFSERVPYENQPDDEEPAVALTGLRYRPNEFDDWGQIRNADGSMFASVRRPASEEELAEHRRAGTDPYEDLARRLMSTFDAPAPPASPDPISVAKAALQACIGSMEGECAGSHKIALHQADKACQMIAGLARPASPDPIGWWYEDKHGCILMSLDMALGRRHEAENGAQLNLLYGKPLPGTAPTPSTHVVVSTTAVDHNGEHIEALVPAREILIADEIERVVQSVNEWDDRTSPDDYPDHLLITSEELTDILCNFAETLATSEASR
jgi:hypothetical protein